MRRPSLRFAAAATLLAAFAVVFPEPNASRAQIKAVPRPPRETAKVEEPKYEDAVTLPRNPEAKRLIQAAQDYIKKKEWRIAGDCLQSLLDLPEDSFFEVSRKNERGDEMKVKVSVRSEANRIIGELSADGLESYRLQFGAVAEDKLKEALNLADPGMLAEVSQKYFHTDAGLKATDFLGTYHLDRGQYLMAALCYERLFGRPDADKLPAKVLFKASLAYRRAGMVAQAEPLFSKFAEQARRNDVVFGKARANVELLRNEYSRELGADLQVGLFDWPVFRGNPSRTAQGQGSTAYLERRWTPISIIKPEESTDQRDLSAEKWIDQQLNVAMARLKDKPILPAFFPIAANGRLMVRTYNGVSAFALRDGTFNNEAKKAGELLWSQTATNSLFNVVKGDMNGKRGRMEEWYTQDYVNSNVGPVGIFFENSVLGAICHDGQRVYFVDDLAVPPHPNRLSAGNNIGFSSTQVNLAPFTDDVECSRLMAANIVTGSLSWQILGGRPQQAEPEPKDGKKELNAARELLNTHFLGPPLPLGGKLYLLTEKEAELRLVCLDPSRLVPSALNQNDLIPDLLWIQPLGSAKTKIKQDGLRRTHAAHLAYADGILVCPTNAGAVLGVDLLSHSLVWSFSYRKEIQNNDNDENIRFRRVRPFTAHNSAALNDRWRASAPCIVGGRVVFTAPDGPGTEIHCLNLRDGLPIWTAKRDDNDLYLAGCFGDKVLIVAKNHVRALSLEAGKEVWKQSETGLPCGQGVAADGVYYLPLANSVDPKTADKGPEVCSIDLKNGAIVGRSKARNEPLGNLLFLEGEMVAQSPKAVASYPLLKVKQQEINETLAKNPRDPIGLTDRGVLHLYNGAMREAVADLRVALANQPPVDTKAKARAKLHEALTYLLQRDFAGAEQYLNEYAELSKVDVPEKAPVEERQKLMSEQIRRQASYLELVGRGREQQGRALDAFLAYEEYGALAGHKELVDSLEQPNTKARPDIWSRGRIQALLATAPETERKKIEAEIAKRWEQVRTAPGLVELRKFVTMYGPISAIGPTARLTLAERLMATNEPDDLSEAERVLATLCFAGSQRRDDPDTAVRATDMMIRVCLRRGNYENAVGFYRQLSDEFPDHPVRDGKTARQLYDELMTDKRFVPYLDTPTAVWSGPVSAKKVTGTHQSRELTATIVPQGELPPFYQRNRVALDMRFDGGQTSWSLRVLDRLTGEERWKVPGLPAAMYLYNAQGSIPFAFAHGQQLILHLNEWVYAYDLVERKELWRRNLLGDNDMRFAPDANRLAYDLELGLHSLSADEKKTAIGRVALVENSYVTLQTRNGLIAIDATRPGPSVLWMKSDVSPKARVFGDERHVFIFDKEASGNHKKFQALRANDGMPIPCKDCSEFMGKSLRTMGGRILVSESAGQAVRLIDALTAKEVWRRDLAAGSTIVQTDDVHLVAAIEPGGLFILLDAYTGKLRFTSRLRPEHVEKLRDATLLADHDRFYLTLNRSADQGMNWSSAAGFGVRSVQINGPMYAFSRRTGKFEWSCEFLEYQTFLTEQWADLPVLLFATQYHSYSATGRAERQGVRVAAVEKSTGKLKFNEELPQTGQFHALTANPSAGRVELIRQDLKVVFSTPDSVALPELPAGPPQPRPGAGFRIAPRIVPVPVVPPPPAKKGN